MEKLTRIVNSGELRQTLEHRFPDSIVDEIVHLVSKPKKERCSHRRKLRAAEEMARALHAINGWSKCQCGKKHGDNTNCPVLIAEVALQQWKKAGEGEG